MNKVISFLASLLCWPF